MTSCTLRSSLVAALFAIAALPACHNDQTNGVGCPNDQYCITEHGGDDRWYCDKTQAIPTCEEAARECNTADDCCPSQVCYVQGHFCADKFTSCTGPGSCPVQGEICETIGVRPSGLGCTFAQCTAAGTCTDSSTVCFNSYCVGAPPCNGGCPPLNNEDQVCVTATNYCSPAPKDSGGTCQRTCPVGQMLVLHNPANIFDTCDLATETCDCVELPPLVVHDVARHSSLAQDSTSLYISAYDGEYGDLVVHTYSKGTLSAPTKSQWLDGVPATGTLGGDPNGPRGGITNPGPNVGQYTSIAATTTGDLYVSYYDVDNGDLKFIARYGGQNAAWIAPITLDGTSASGGMTGDVGLYTSIALTSGNVPAIAYFQRGSLDPNTGTETGVTTALYYIVATKPQPALRTDWSAPILVETLNRPATPCGGGCSASQVCIADTNASGGSRCATPSASCASSDAGTCTGTNTCVQGTDANQTPVCAASLQAAAQPDVPQGTGLMPSLKFKDDLPVIAYYDSVNQALKAVIGGSIASGATQTTPGFAAPVVIDGLDASPAPKRDTGRYPALAIGPAGSPGGRIAISFQDLTSQQFLLYQADTLISHALHDVGTTHNQIHVIDTGIPLCRSSGTGCATAGSYAQTFPGVQSGIAFTPSGKLALAYQDGTLVDLQFVQWDPSAFTVTGAPSVVHGNDHVTAAGFYPRVVIDPTTATPTAYLSSATIKAATAEQSANKLNVDSLSAP